MNTSTFQENIQFHLNTIQAHLTRFDEVSAYAQSKDMFLELDRDDTFIYAFLDAFKKEPDAFNVAAVIDNTIFEFNIGMLGE